MEQMPHTGKLESKRTDAPTFDEGRAGNANARYEFVHLPQYAPTYAGQGLIKEVVGLDQSREFDAIGWIEAVSELMPSTNPLAEAHAVGRRSRKQHRIG
jgi:hypothetical protein